MRARIFQRSRTATQSAMADVGSWVFEFQPTDREVNDPLTGWWGSRNTEGQVHLRFDTKDAAIAFADSKGVQYDLKIPPVPKAPVPKVYADNFKYNRIENWTH